MDAPAPDEKMMEAIAFFEQMLQSMPEDRTSLEFLSVAYEQTGQVDKYRDCLVRLAECLLHEKDYDSAQAIALRLGRFADYGPARVAVEHVSECLQQEKIKKTALSQQEGAFAPVGGAGQGPSFPDEGMEIHALSRAVSASEIELVWHWKEHNFLPKELCMDILHILTETQIPDRPILISALALLDEQHPEWTERVMEDMQRSSNIPPIPLELFEIQPAALSLLSPVFIHIKGVLPFALFGGEVLVAVLNPLNPALREEVVNRIRKPCHFFFVHPRIWQEAVEKI